MGAVPYLGVAGIVTPDDVRATADAWLATRHLAPAHRCMGGVLVSYKTLARRPTASRRYPPIHDVPALVEACWNAGLWPALHYNTRATGDDFRAELRQLLDAVPGACTLQLNVANPDATVLRSLIRQRPQLELILQINRAALGAQYAEGLLSPNGAIGHAAYYVHIARHALLDLSGGTGRPLDVEWAVNVLHDPDLWAYTLGMRPGIAGGLGPGCAPLLATLRERLGADWARELSTDAESALRVPVSDPAPGEKHQDQLSGEKVKGYLRDVVTGLFGNEGA